MDWSGAECPGEHAVEAVVALEGRDGGSGIDGILEGGADVFFGLEGCCFEDCGGCVWCLV